MTREAFPFELDVCACCEKTFRRPTSDAIAQLAVKPELRVVYRSFTGRRFLTSRGAYMKYAFERIRAKWPCDRSCEETIGGGPMISFCEEKNHYEGNWKKLALRFVRWLVWHDGETRKRGVSPLRRDGK